MTSYVSTYKLGEGAGKKTGRKVCINYEITKNRERSERKYTMGSSPDTSPTPPHPFLILSDILWTTAS